MLRNGDFLSIQVSHLEEGRGRQAMRALEGAGATRQEWAQWWEENKDKPLPHDTPSAEEPPPAP